jgi:hypothetical protein
MTRERWMALFFAAGAACFVIGPFPGYASLVGDGADSVTISLLGWSMPSSATRRSSSARIRSRAELR